jgi:hypothetical protein
MDKLEKRQLERIGEPLQLTEIILTDVRILRAVNNEAVVRKLSTQVVVEVIYGGVGLDQILRPTFKSVLANHYGAALAGLHTAWQQKNTVCEYIGPNRQIDFVTGPRGLVINFPSLHSGWAYRF